MQQNWLMLIPVDIQRELVNATFVNIFLMAKLFVQIRNDNLTSKERKGGNL